MSEVNPYQTPSSDVTVASEGSQGLAGRGERLIASIVDGVLMMVVVLPVMYLMGIFTYISNGTEPPLSLMVIATVISFVAFVAINYVPLSKNGQTVGKKLLNIRIADLQGNKPELSTIILKRYLPVQVINQIPLIGGLAGFIDILLIFRKDRRCIHDLIAGTQVVRAK